MAIDTTQTLTGMVDAADILVKIEKQQMLAPQEHKYTNICVLATKKGSAEDLQGKLITDKSSVENDIEEISELDFTASVRIWNVTLTENVIKEMQGYAESLVVLSGRTADVKAKDFGDMIVWLTETAATTSLDALVRQPYRGAMIDPGKQGKLLFALSHMLHNDLGYTNQIVNTAFTGVADPDMAAALDAAGYSYFFKAHDKTWLRGFWLGGRQARAEYADRSVQYDVKQAVATLVASGLVYTDANLALIEAKILQALKANAFVDNVISVSVPRNQKASDKVKGLVLGVQVKFQTANELRMVYVKLGGEV